MLKHLVQWATLKGRERTGFSVGMVVWIVIAVVAVFTAFAFICLAGFFWLDTLYGPIAAAAIVAGVSLVIAILSLIISVIVRKRTIKIAHAQLVLASAARQQSASNWLSPETLGIGLQLTRMIGAKRLLPLAAAGILAMELGKGWVRHSKAKE